MGEFSGHRYCVISRHCGRESPLRSGGPPRRVLVLRQNFFEIHHGSVKIFSRSSCEFEIHHGAPTQKRRGNFAQFFPRQKFFGKQVLSTEHEDRPNASSFLSPVAPHWGLVVQVSPRRTTPSKPFELEQSRHTTKVCFCRTIQLPKRHPLLHAPHAHDRPSRSNAEHF